MEYKRCNWCWVEVRDFTHMVGEKGFCCASHAKNHTDIKGGKVEKQKDCKIVGNKKNNQKKYEKRT